MQEYFDVLTQDGDYADRVETREKCHEEGLWHKAVVLIILSTDNKKVLLQQRSANKKLWPNKWDITAGGHVLAGEYGYQAIIRETEEELGLKIEKNDMEFIGATTSETTKGNIINKHFNEYYIVHKDIDIKDIKLQEEEVQDIKWFDKEEVIRMVKNNYEDLTEKISCWNHLIRYLKMMEK